MFLLSLLWMSCKTVFFFVFCMQIKENRANECKWNFDAKCVFVVSQLDFWSYLWSDYMHHITWSINLYWILIYYWMFMLNMSVYLLSSTDLLNFHYLHYVRIVRFLLKFLRRIVRFVRIVRIIRIVLKITSNEWITLHYITLQWN